MKTLNRILATLAMMAITTVGFSQITGSSHDFSGRAWANSVNGEICIVCHTPHNASTATVGAPLWNHEESTAVYTLYSSPTLDAGPLGQPAGASKLCLGCHDGTVAVDNFGGMTGGTEVISGAALIGIDLSDDHPISFTYDAALAGTDGGLFDPTLANSGLGGTIDTDLLFANKMECSSCHDVHDNTIPNFLRLSNNTSALCLTCHDK